MIKASQSNKIFTIPFCWILFACIPVYGLTPAYHFSTTTTDENFLSTTTENIAQNRLTGTAQSRIEGWEFEVNTDITITHLGYFDAESLILFDFIDVGNSIPIFSGEDGLLIDHTIGLWAENGDILVSVTLQSGTSSPEFQNYRYVEIPAVQLNSGEKYIVATFLMAGMTSDNNFDAYPVLGDRDLPPSPLVVETEFIDQITFIRDRFGLPLSEDLEFPIGSLDGMNFLGTVNFLIRSDIDTDGDGVLDSIDAFPFDSTESVDTDGDGIGNNADTDDDGDGMTDEEEVDVGRNPLVNEPAVILLIFSSD